MSSRAMQNEMLRQQIEDWAGQMMARTPIEQWGMELGELLVYWAKDFGVMFTRQSLEALQAWMSREQELA